MGRGNGEREEGNDEGETGRGATLRGRQGGGDGEWETGRGMTVRGATGWGRWGGRQRGG